eukprot:Rhum_TRINITY_DN9217_c0_g1::Rhum_TRINITY_DN9217_c0_g1_i1::g.32748::m.32748
MFWTSLFGGVCVYHSIHFLLRRRLDIRVTHRLGNGRRLGVVSAVRHQRACGIVHLNVVVARAPLYPSRFLCLILPPLPRTPRCAARAEAAQHKQHPHHQHKRCREAQLADVQPVAALLADKQTFRRAVCHDAVGRHDERVVVGPVHVVRAQKLPRTAVRLPTHGVRCTRLSEAHRNVHKQLHLRLRLHDRGRALGGVAAAIRQEKVASARRAVTGSDLLTRGCRSHPVRHLHNLDGAPRVASRVEAAVHNHREQLVFSRRVGGRRVPDSTCRATRALRAVHAAPAHTAHARLVRRTLPASAAGRCRVAAAAPVLEFGKAALVAVRAGPPVRACPRLAYSRHTRAVGRKPRAPVRHLAVRLVRERARPLLAGAGQSIPAAAGVGRARGLLRVVARQEPHALAALPRALLVGRTRRRVCVARAVFHAARVVLPLACVVRSAQERVRVRRAHLRHLRCTRAVGSKPRAPGHRRTSRLVLRLGARLEGALLRRSVPHTAVGVVLAALVCLL